MARIKIDGVIEAVRYAPNGKIALVRAYERRGAVWSDHVLLDRKGLIERLSKRRRFVTGRRRSYLGSLFETGLAVQVLGDHVVSGASEDGRDQLDGVPVF